MESLLQELVLYWFLFYFTLFFSYTITLISFHLWWLLGGSVWIWMRKKLLWFIEGQTHINTFWHTNMSLNHNEPRENDLVQTSTLPPSMHQKLTEGGRCWVQNNPPLTKFLFELIDNSNLNQLLAFMLVITNKLCYWHIATLLVLLCIVAGGPRTVFLFDLYSLHVSFNCLNDVNVCVWRILAYWMKACLQRFPLSWIL
jgi:hypothetical protein